PADEAYVEVDHVLVTAGGTGPRREAADGGNLRHVDASRRRCIRGRGRRRRRSWLSGVGLAKRRETLAAPLRIRSHERGALRASSFGDAHGRSFVISAGYPPLSSEGTSPTGSTDRFAEPPGERG